MGRKRLYNPENLAIGAKMQLFGPVKKFKDQYLYQFNNRGAEKFRTILEGRKVFLERIL